MTASFFKLMAESIPNKIVHSSSGFMCVALVIGAINIGGLVIDESQFQEMHVNPIENYAFRYYRNSKKIVISSNSPIEFEYAAVKMNYSMWKCLICKRISKYTESDCFCNSYSLAWTPINAEITGIEFNNDGDFRYHFQDNFLTNLIS